MRWVGDRRGGFYGGPEMRPFQIRDLILSCIRLEVKLEASEQQGFKIQHPNARHEKVASADALLVSLP